MRSSEFEIRNPELLRAEGVNRTYRLGRTEIPVLRGLDLEVARGESVCILGRSGAGKSTLLHVLGGLDQPEQGRVWIDGEDVYAAREGRRAWIRAVRIGFVFQSYHLLPELDVVENVMLPAMTAGGRRLNGVGRERALYLLEQVGLADRGRHMPMELSGGEQQRVAIARAMMNRPALILADEPTGNLDAETGRRVLDALFAVARDQPTTIVLVTHDTNLVARCGRALRIVDGQLVAGA